MRKIYTYCLQGLVIVLIAIATLVIMYFTFPYVQKHLQTVRAMMSIEQQYTKKHLSIGESVITVFIADTDTKRSLGLSNREFLPSKQGMFFVFPHKDTYGIWMKDMNFPIDILWIDDQYKIIHIEENISPTTYPRVFKPLNPALYVLEVNASYVKNNSIKKGDSITVY